MDVMPRLHKWFIIEIITFYSLIASAILYLFMASIFPFKRTDLLVEYNKNSDFLTWSSDIYDQFGLGATLLGITVVVQVIEGQLICPNGQSYQAPMTALIVVHSYQFLFNIFVFYGIDDARIALSICVLCISIVPLFVFIYIAVGTGVLHGC